MRQQAPLQFLKQSSVSLIICLTFPILAVRPASIASAVDAPFPQAADLMSALTVGTLFVRVASYTLGKDPPIKAFYVVLIQFLGRIAQFSAICITDLSEAV